MDDISFWLALARVTGLGPVRCRALLDRYGNPRRLFAEAPADPGVRRGLSPATIQALEQPDRAAVDRDLAWLAEPGHEVLTLHDPRYPALLRQIHQAPLLLYIDGDPAAPGRPQIAIVGSRNPTAAGCDTAHAFAAELARHGLAITSGLAIGIDAAAHAGALAGGGQTIAVAATGPDEVYPARHRALADRIRAQGAVVTETPPGSPLVPGSFPRRNRIISGLSLGTLVVEANPRSGSLITARAALEQGREVFAIPGSIHNPCARGCHLLIRQGAKLVECTGDILEELEPMAGAALEMLKGAVRAETHAPPQETAAGILELIDFAPTTIDTLVERTGHATEQLYPVLLDLELSNLITQAPGGAYMRRPART
jgi:DNA processing protein